VTALQPHPTKCIGESANAGARPYAPLARATSRPSTATFAGVPRVARVLCDRMPGTALVDDLLDERLFAQAAGPAFEAMTNVAEYIE